MLTMLGGQRRFCDGVTRRETLKAGSLAMLGGLSLPGLLRAESVAGNKRPGKAKSVVLMYLHGGVPTQDMFDRKPEAPVEVQTAVVQEFQPQRTSTKGNDEAAAAVRKAMQERIAADFTRRLDGILTSEQNIALEQAAAQEKVLSANPKKK